jgi:hypothetical protein
MEPTAVVDLLDEAWKVLDDVGERLVRHRIDRFDLERLHEALSLGVVIRIATPPHRADAAMSKQGLAIS